METQVKYSIKVKHFITFPLKCLSQMLKRNTSSTVNSGYRSTWKISLLCYSPRKCLFFLSLSWWSHLLSEHLATKWDLLLVPYSYWKMLLLEYFSCQNAPQSDQSADANFWAHGGSPGIKSIWQLGIGSLLPLTQVQRNQCLFNLEGEKLEWNKNDRHSAPFQIPFMLPGILLFFYFHLESSCFSHHCWSNSDFVSQILLGLSSPRLGLM